MKVGDTVKVQFTAYRHKGETGTIVKMKGKFVYVEFPDKVCVWPYYPEDLIIVK